MRYLLLVSGLFLFTTITPTFSQQDSILMFVSFDSTYYSEYIVMREALEAMGYYVDVRSADIGMAHTYLIGGNLTAQANGLSGSNYSAFESQYQSMVGSPWNAALNTDPGVINITDSIQSISSMASYKALVIVGGKGVVRYRLDGQYSSQLSLPASRVQSAAHKLNDLATEALLLGKPVMGQCHGASIPAFWRVPNTEGSGFDNLGLSLLEGSMATGYPEPETATNLMDLNINFRSEDKVVIGTPSNSFMDNDAGTFRVITTRDWYPQTVVHAAKTLTNVIETYPLTSELTTAVSVLIIHGGAVDTDNCSAGNRNNDVPCNYGNDAANLPADYTDLVALFNSNEFNDNFNFVVSDVDISNNPPFDLNNETEILNYLKSFDVLFFYKHWSDFVSVDLQNAIVTFADDGGGVVSIHHGLYNDIHNGFDKNIMVNDLFEAESPQSGWSATRDTFQILQTNYGHFVSSYQIINEGVSSTPTAWSANPNPPGSNLSLSLYPRFQVFDEIYNNMQFVSGVTFGDGINEITPLFSNNRTIQQQCHVHGFVKRFDGNGDEKVGRLVYGQSGETIANYQYPSPYAQFLRNAVIWAKGSSNCTLTNTSWTGGTGTWDNSANWTENQLPDICTEVIIPDQVSENTVTISPGSDINIRLLQVGLNVIFEIPSGTTFTVSGNNE